MKKILSIKELLLFVLDYKILRSCHILTTLSTYTIWLLLGNQNQRLFHPM